MKRVTGLGGVFLKVRDPEKLYAWYEKHLGMKRQSPEAFTFEWRDANNPRSKGLTVWGLFPSDSKENIVSEYQTFNPIQRISSIALLPGTTPSLSL